MSIKRTVPRASPRDRRRDAFLTRVHEAHGQGAPQVRLSASAVDEGRAVEVRWEIEGEATRCVAEGDHPLWSGIEAGPSVPSGSWRHYPAGGDLGEMRLSLRCEHGAANGLATLRIDAAGAPN